MTGTRREWIILAALVAVMGLSAILAGQEADDATEPAPNPSSYNSKGSGSQGLLVWLQELGFRVRRWEEPLTSLPGETAVLLVLGPRRPVEENELARLDLWVRRGGTLVLADDQVGAPVPGLWPGPPALKFGLRARPAGQPGRLRPSSPSRLIEGVESLHPTGRVRFQREEPQGWTPLFGDASGLVVAVRRLERGTIVAVSDPGLWSNARIESAGHARLLLNIVGRHAGTGTVLIDEFHHGYGEPGGLWRYLKATAIPAVLAQAALALLALALARAIRFGPPVPSVPESRASNLEYVEGLGDLYRRAKARRLAAEALAASLLRRLRGVLGVRAGEEPGSLAARAAGRLGLRPGQVGACLKPGRAMTGSDEGLVRLARAVHAIESRLSRAQGSTPGRPRERS